MRCTLHHLTHLQFNVTNVERSAHDRGHRLVERERHAPARVACRHGARVFRPLLGLDECPLRGQTDVNRGSRRRRHLARRGRRHRLRQLDGTARYLHCRGNCWGRCDRVRARTHETGGHQEQCRRGASLEIHVFLYVMG